MKGITMLLQVIVILI